MSIATSSPGGVVEQISPTIKLHAEGLCKKYGNHDALKPIDLRVNSGELLTLLGPSGSGKTTLLQLIAGLVSPSGGCLLIDGEDQTLLEPHKRDIGVVFQSYSLFPHMTVHENIAFPLEMRRWSKSASIKRVAESLEMVGLDGFERRFPHELSGGQQQRVALARCLVYRPSLILMDESLSALDRKLREAMQVEIKRIHRETGSTIIFVTHDQEEALALSDRVCLMCEGQIEQIGTPQELYDRPTSVFAAGFVGISNFVQGKIDAGGRLQTNLLRRAIDFQSAIPVGADVSFSIRPESVRIGNPGEGLMDGRIIESIYLGSETKLLVEVKSGSAFTVRLPSSSNRFAFQERISLDWDVQDMRVLQA